MRYTILFFLFFSFITRGQDFDQRFAQIENQIESLSSRSVPQLMDTATFSVSQTPLSSFIRTIGKVHKLNVLVDPKLNEIPVTYNFESVLVKDLILFISKEYKVDIRVRGNILAFNLFKEPPVPAEPYREKKLSISYNPSDSTVSFDVERDSLKLFVKQLTAVSGINVVADQSVRGQLVTGYIQRLPLDTALNKLSVTNDLYLEKQGEVYVFYKSENIDRIPEGGQLKANNRRSNVSRRNAVGNQVRNRPPSLNVRFKDDSTFLINAENIEIEQLISELSFQSKDNFLLTSKIDGSLSLFLNGVTFEQALSAILSSTEHDYSISDGVYIIGQSDSRSFAEAEFLKLNFRPSENIMKDIPQNLIQDVEIKEIKELNGLVLSGSKQRIRLLKSFITQIDKPVANIMIEVIVIELKKGFNLQTGIQAFLADSTVQTGGKVFPGVDMTISSNSINSVLEKFANNGFINLGRVTPRFYMTLKALEDNNNIDIRSTPKLSTLNGHEAKLTIGESVYYVEQTQNITGGVNPITTTSQRFNQVEANLNININPVVSANDHVTLAVTAEFSNFIPPEVQNAPPGNATRMFDSQIRVKNEEMIVLGGLEEVSKSKSSSGTPLLSRIPILKWLFSTRSQQNSESRLLVFIRPTIVN
ncbi:type II secretion system protein GspD [Mangrovivirga cuniculi]|uniref:Secretin/TonB short N-terminal domain-containing protein n=1 Tax=Mangrovivirga cuniculi TaxID=2715131 RepID=A0A4D7K2Y8_9BACT|nr:hypothetical protein [Mangrovivirga cuniculi]QCK13768.1 hypothetical protein DCC35_02845 [Mangrovivirga cuniculi]